MRQKIPRQTRGRERISPEGADSPPQRRRVEKVSMNFACRADRVMARQRGRGKKSAERRHLSATMSRSCAPGPFASFVLGMLNRSFAVR